MIDPIFAAEISLAAIQFGFIYLAVMYIMYVGINEYLQRDESRLTTALIPKVLIYYPFIGYMYFSAICTVLSVSYLTYAIWSAS